MKVPEPDLRMYYNELYSFLNLLKDEIQTQSQALVKDYPEALDAYLLDLNTYYYQSFNERFFPVYKSQLESEIMALYRISREEATLKEDIIKNLKRIAQIYNRIKSGSQLLKTNRESVYNLLLNSDRGREQRIVELLYTLKDLEQSLNSFLNLLTSYQDCLSDQQLIHSLSEYPFQVALHSLSLTWDFDNSRFIRDFKRLMINCRLMVQLLIKLQQSDDPCVEARNNVLNDLQKLEASMGARKSSPLLTSWYKQHIQSQLLIYLNLLGLYVEKNDRKSSVKAAHACEEWMRALLYLLEKTTLSPENLGPVFLDLPMLSLAQRSSNLKELSDISTNIAQSLKELIKNLSSSAQPKFDYFHTSAGLIMAEAQSQYKKILNQKNIPHGTVLANALSRLAMQLSLLDGQLELLQAKEEHALRLRQQYEIMLQNMDSYHELLQEIKNELSRALAPRNINRNFKDMDVRVEQISINQGELFPARYLHLLDSSQLTDDDALEQEYIVTEEEGDIFIFKLDELYEELIPPIVISRKGY